MSLSIGIGGDVDYYERDADNEHVRRDEDGRDQHDLHQEHARTGDYYTGDVKAGRELDGMWRGPGAGALGLTGKVNSWQLHKLYGEHIDPVTGIELGSRPRKYRSPEERLAAKLAEEPFATSERRREIELSVSQKTPQSRQFFDLTFSLPKSYSVLYASLVAAGRAEDAQKLIDAHHHAIDQSMKILMAEAGYSRKGHHGRTVAGYSSGERIDAHDFVYSIFDHRLSRCGDPQLHSHVLLLNKALCTDGVWRALDSDVIVRQMQRSIGALHERFMAEESARTMGLQHRPRVDGFGWEVEGITQEDMDLYSTRRRAIDPVAEEMTAKFVSQFNREPNARERDSIQQAATLATRPAKAHDLTFDQYVAQWIERFGTERDHHLTEILGRVPMGAEHETSVHGAWNRSELLKMAIARVEQLKPTWTRPDLRRVLSDLLPPNLGRSTDVELVPYLDSLVDEAVRSERVLTLSQAAAVEAPSSLRNANGRSIYEPTHVERFTTDARLRNEGRLAALALRTDGPRMAGPDAARLIDETTLYPDQARVVQEVLIRGRRLTFVEAKAGTGKSFTIGQVAKLWDFGIAGKVQGLAKSQGATDVLVKEGVAGAVNFDRFRMAHEIIAAGGPRAKAFSEQYGVTPQTLLIVDEISTLNDDERFWLEEFARTHDVSMLWVGDRGQVGAVGPDAALEVLAQAVPPLELDTARRFTNEWEGPASLRLHDGEVGAIGIYEAHGRIVSGTREEMNRQAVEVLVADILGGHDATLMVPTTALADEFSSHVRRQLIELGHVDAGATVMLRNEAFASVGDVIQARKTLKQLPGAELATSITNRDMFQVLAIEVDGALVVRQQLGHDATTASYGEPRVLPAAYVKKHVDLGYVTTVHSKIGRTVANGYVLVTNSSDWHGVYTGSTRGANLNVIFVPVEHEDGVPIETGAQVLAKIAQAQHVEHSATEWQHTELEAVTHLARLGPVYEDLVAKHSRQQQEDIFKEVLPPAYFTALQTDETAAALYRLTTALAREGRDVEHVVREAVERGELGSANSIGQVLHWRITRGVGPVAPQDVATERTRYVDGVPPGETPELNYLSQVANVMDERVSELAERQATEPEPWARRHLGDVPHDPIDRLEWQERAAHVASYREQYGITDPANAIGEAPGRSAAEQRAAWENAYVAIGRPAENEDVARLSEGELLLTVDQYKRIEAWLPPDVSERLAVISTSARDYSTDAALDRARGAVDAAERGERMAARMAETAAKFERVDAARRLAEDFTAIEREQANVSQRELDRRRGLDEEPEPDTRPQTETEHRPFTIDEALDRARQVTQEIEAEHAYEQEQQRSFEHDDQGHEQSRDQGHSY